jgi:chemotaxis protein CheC
LKVQIEINVPWVRLVNPEEIGAILIKPLVAEHGEVTLVQQVFHGDFHGEAVLAFPGRHTVASLVRMLEEDSGFRPDMEIDKLEIEVLLELSNIVIGACLGKLAGLLKTTISFRPPRIFRRHVSQVSIEEGISSSKNEALLIQTSFRVAEREVTGYLLIFLTSDCLNWLFKTVDEFVEELSG